MAVKDFIRRLFLPDDIMEATQTLHPHTTQTFESNRIVLDADELEALEEARQRRKLKQNNAGPQNLSLAWDDASSGIPGSLHHGETMSEREKKDTYYRAYITNPWVRACVQAISKRFTSGNWEIEDIADGNGDKTHYEVLKQLFLFVNEDEDFKQLLRSIAEDIGIYGECFLEIVYDNNGLPSQLHKIDCQSMHAEYDKHGSVVKYVQALDRNHDVVEFEPHEIIRWWLPDPRAGKKALSPIECMKDSIYLYQSMITWGEKFFKQGAQPSFSIEMSPDSQLDEAARYIKFFRENYLGIQNAHIPPIAYGGAKINQFGKGSVELDFLKSLAWSRDEILAGYNVPLSVTGIQEVAHLGAGSGESANKLFIYNVVKPIEEIILEKINYRIIQKGFGIYDWRLTVQHADYRDDEGIARINDIQVRNGTMLINESRQEHGRNPVEGGNEAVIISGREVTPIARLSQLADEQEQTANAEIEAKRAEIDNIKKQAEYTAITIQQTKAAVENPDTTLAQNERNGAVHDDKTR